MRISVHIYVTIRKKAVLQTSFYMSAPKYLCSLSDSTGTEISTKSTVSPQKTDDQIYIHETFVFS